MSKKRKSSDVQSSDTGPRIKRKKTTSLSDIKGEQHPVLRLHYENVRTLREYILARFPNSSVSRKQRINAIFPWVDNPSQLINGGKTTPPTLATVSIGQRSAISETHIDFSKLLDTTIIGFQTVRSRRLGGPAISNLYQPQNIQQLSQKLRGISRSTSSQVSDCQHQVWMSLFQLLRSDLV